MTVQNDWTISSDGISVEALASVWRDSRAAEEQRKQGREEQKLLDNLIQK